MDPGHELITSYSERDVSEPRKEIMVVHSAPEVTLKSILKTSSSNGKMEATESGPPKERRVKVQWQPQVEVIYYAGDSIVGIEKENLSEEMDQLARKAAYARGNTRTQPSLALAPFLEENEIGTP